MKNAKYLISVHDSNPYSTNQLSILYVKSIRRYNKAGIQTVDLTYNIKEAFKINSRISAIKISASIKEILKKAPHSTESIRIQKIHET